MRPVLFRTNAMDRLPEEEGVGLVCITYPRLPSKYLEVVE